MNANEVFFYGFLSSFIFYTAPFVQSLCLLLPAYAVQSPTRLTSHPEEFDMKSQVADIVCTILGPAYCVEFIIKHGEGYFFI